MSEVPGRAGAGQLGGVWKRVQPQHFLSVWESGPRAERATPMPCARPCPAKMLCCTERGVPGQERGAGSRRRGAALAGHAFSRAPWGSPRTGDVKKVFLQVVRHLGASDRCPPVLWGARPWEEPLLSVGAAGEALWRKGGCRGCPLPGVVREGGRGGRVDRVRPVVQRCEAALGRPVSHAWAWLGGARWLRGEG